MILRVFWVWHLMDVALSIFQVLSAVRWKFQLRFRWRDLHKNARLLQSVAPPRLLSVIFGRDWVAADPQLSFSSACGADGPHLVVKDRAKLEAEVPLRQISVVLSDLSRRSGLSCGVSDRSVI
jgi:hypothetical protein